jgi:hypothetical protein
MVILHLQCPDCGFDDCEVGSTSPWTDSELDQARLRETLCAVTAAAIGEIIADRLGILVTPVSQCWTA